jgi:hypothetical protein
MTKSNPFLRYRKTRNQRRRKSRKSSRASKRSRHHRRTMRGGYLGFGIQPYATVIRRPIEEDKYAAPITTLYSEVEKKDVVP